MQTCSFMGIVPIGKSGLTLWGGEYVLSKKEAAAREGEKK
jgi:hypothetical protein